jgi:hypothetical protein
MIFAAALRYQDQDAYFLLHLAGDIDGRKHLCAIHYCFIIVGLEYLLD